MNKGTYFILGILAILAIAGIFLYATGFDPSAPGGSAESKKAIRTFIGDPDAVVVFEKSNRNVLGEPYDTYRVNKDRFIVDPDTGTVIGASFFSVPMTNERKIYLQQAQSSAREFAARHYYDFYSRTMLLTESKMSGGGHAGIEYSYTWTEQAKGSNTTNIVTVSTNTEGKVVSYYARDKTPPTAGPATIGKDQAIETATRYVIDTTKIANITSKDTSARLDFTPYHERMIWVVELQLRFTEPRFGIEDHQGGWVKVDAMTGEVVNYSPCQ